MLHQIMRTEPTDTSGSATGQLNASVFTAPQFQAALETLAAVPGHARGDVRAQALALRGYGIDALASDDPTVSAALHARVTALAGWTAAHDPGRLSNAEAVIEAAARFPLTDLADGIGFEPAGFQEMILFIEELPW